MRLAKRKRIMVQPTGLQDSSLATVEVLHSNNPSLKDNFSRRGSLVISNSLPSSSSNNPRTSSPRQSMVLALGMDNHSKHLFMGSNRTSRPGRQRRWEL
jgi:hypothetical protein